MKLLSVCKKNDHFKKATKSELGSGLSNSQLLLAEGLINFCEAEVIEVGCKNELSFEIKFRHPDVVIIQALWMSWEDLNALMHTYPRTKFYVHIHSQIPFLATENTAMQFIWEYDQIGVELICNAPEAAQALSVIYSNKVYFLPNCYPRAMMPVAEFKDKPHVDIGCFGSIRPMKNHLNQMIAAIAFAGSIGKKLRVHINATRVEGNGGHVLNNVIRLMHAREGCELVCMPWKEPAAFREYLKGIDIGLQLSMTETFNIVTADMIASGIPIVVSNNINWVRPESQTSCENIGQIVNAMKNAYGNQSLVKANQQRLSNYNNDALMMWRAFLNA